ncbi:efflux RND transporter periplasmic adaptor subunit [Aliiruegeria sabulilitoris]|uniref:efflux RND transporter periplasmic adaptor subunit n=1 Tax=Aliiruegeria sabulilitoris TaxID=1510458 RepID=UPI00082E1645|nr:efflux RND transporter periplasmic adaptor subunit [Aliiruegeria sabulilitoris]NDR59688.1 efflux RND transporter periplasmic adaptor subunit [Pseudoruegeria sp. M32A2M]
MLRYFLPLIAALLPLGAMAEGAQQVRSVELTEWKAVFGRIEARDRVPARSRLGGTLLEVGVAEGSKVEEGQQIATVQDEKLALQLGAIDATLDSLRSQLENAMVELKRGESLLERGVTTAQRLDQLRTQVDVIEGQIGSTEAEKNVLLQREAEGAVLAPISGTVLNVPVTEGSVVLSGEQIAEIGGGGFFLRLAVPERHAGFLEEGAEIRIGGEGAETTGTLAKLYPLIENGRMIADVEVEGIATDFVDARVLVRLPIGKQAALVVPAEAVATRMGLDFVTISGAEGTAVQRAVVIGAMQEVDGAQMVQILSGVTEGEELVMGHE